MKNPQTFREKLEALRNPRELPCHNFYELLKDWATVEKLFRSREAQVEDLDWLFDQRVHRVNEKTMIDRSFTEMFLNLARAMLRARVIDVFTVEKYVAKTTWVNLDNALFMSLWRTGKRSFVELAQTYSPFSEFVKQTDLFKYFAKRDLLSRDDLKWVRDRLVEKYDLSTLKAFSRNRHLLKIFLKTLIVDDAFLDAFFKTNVKRSRWCMNRELKTFYDVVLHRGKSDEAICQLVDLNRAVVNQQLSDDQRQTLSDIIRADESAYKNILIVVYNDLWQTFGSFDELLQFLRKSERRRALNL